MKKEYIRTFSIEKLYNLIKEDTNSVEVSPFETYKIDKSFCKFVEERLPNDYEGREETYSELLNIIRNVEENAFAVGFKMAVNLIR